MRASLRWLGIVTGVLAATCAAAPDQQVDPAPTAASPAGRACLEGSAADCWQAGLAARDASPPDALAWFERGCALDDGACCDAAGVAFALGEGTAPDAEHAAALWARACDLQAELGCYRSGRYLEACLLGDHHGCLQAGFTSPLDAAESVCARGDAHLCRLAGMEP